jgi:putative ABC transport system permease protein
VSSCGFLEQVERKQRTPGVERRFRTLQADCRRRLLIFRSGRSRFRANAVHFRGEARWGIRLRRDRQRGSQKRNHSHGMKGEGDDIDRRSVSANYLQLLRIPLPKGRYLADNDREGSTPVLVINQATAQRYWPGQDALGQHIRLNDRERVVVGIVGNIHHLGPETAPRQECYIPASQDRQFGSTLAIRTARDPVAVLPAVKAAIWSINREQRLTGDTVTLERYMDRLIAQRRFNMAVLALFGVLGLVIAGVGIYGVMAYVVAQRTNEIGVRMALGATRGNVVAMVLRRASGLMAFGLAIGGAGAWYLSAGVKSFLFEVPPNDLGIFAAALAVLASAGLLASALPARRAASVDPLIALRSE